MERQITVSEIFSLKYLRKYFYIGLAFALAA